MKEKNVKENNINSNAGNEKSDIISRSIKYARKRVFSDPYFPLYGQNLQYDKMRIRGKGKTLNDQNYAKIEEND